MGIVFTDKHFKIIIAAFAGISTIDSILLRRKTNNMQRSLEDLQIKISELEEDPSNTQ